MLYEIRFENVKKLTISETDNCHLLELRIHYQLAKGKSRYIDLVFRPTDGTKQIPIETLGVKTN